MMTNLLHGAHVANKLFSTIARLRLLLVMFLTLTVSVEVWADYTITFKTGSGSEVTTKAAIIYAGGDYVSSVSAAKTYAESTGLRYGSGSAMGYTTFTLSNEGQIKASKIIFQGAKYYSNDNSSLQYTITYTDASTTSGTIALTSTATDKETTLESSKTISTIDIRKTAKNDKRFYVQGLKIVSAVVENHTVTFDAGSGSCSTPPFTQTSTTRSIDLPTATTTCEGWTFAGWCTSSAGNEDENSTSPGTILSPGTSYTPNSTHTLYAVYTRSESGGTATSYVKVSADNVTTGTYVIAAIRSSSVSSNYYPATGSISSGDMVVSDKTFTLTNETFTEIPDGGIEFTFTGDNTNGFTINNGSGNLGYTSNSNRKLAFGDYTTKWKVFDHNNPQAGVYLQHSEGSSYYTITENSTGTTPIRGYASNTKYRSIYLFKKGNASTTYYMTNLICATETTVTLNPNGGTFTSTPDDWTQDGNNYKQEDVTGSIDLPTPTRTGYNFDGWWYDGETEVNSPYTPSETVTLVAKWNPIKYTIIFNKNNASATGTMSDQKFDYDIAQDLTQNTFILTGYTFSGWNTKADGNGTSYSDKQSVNNLTTTNNTTITLYAQWKINTYKVTFNANGGTGSMSTQIFTHGQEQALNANTFTRDHYTFNGWKDGNDNTYTDKQSITLTADLTLYAQWTAKTYTITLDAGTGECGTESVTTTNASGVTLPTASHTCTDWTFVGWAEESVEETTIAPKLLEADVTYKPTNDIILYAVYSKNEGGGGTTATSIMTYQDGTYYLIDSFTDANSNTTYHSPTGTKAGKLPSVDLTSAVVVNNGILTLDLTKASLNDNMKYTISKENDTYKIYNAETEAYVEPASGTDFKNTGASGWSIDDKNNRFMFNSGTRAFLYQDSYNSNGTKTYGRQFGNYAKSVAGTITNQNGKECYGSGYFFLVPAISSTTTYNSNPTCKYTITWKLNGGQWQGGGTDDRVNNHNYGAEVTKPVDPSRTGYTFAGWSPAEIPSTMPAEDIEFTAQWTPTLYTVIWMLGGTEHATSTVSIENPLSTAPENPSDGDLGCCADKFMGWSSQQSPSAGDIFTKDNIPSNVTTAKTYYAVFATTAQGVGTSIADFSEMGYENGIAVTDQIILGDGEGHGDATITLAKAQSSSDNPTYYNDGKAVRVYAGGTITIASSYHIKNVTFAFGAGDGTNVITANAGTYADGVWTENIESPTNNLIFTIGGEAGQHRRIASITVTTGVSGSQYTNYVTQCTTLPNPALSGGSVPAIAVNCGDFSTLSNSQAIVFSTMQDLTCPVTFEVTEGNFLISTAKDRAAQYQSKIIVTPTKSGENIGKLKNVYVRANATDHNTDFTGTIMVTSDELTEDVIINLTADVTCEAFTITTVDHLDNKTVSGTYFAGEVIATRPTSSSDACTAGYTFAGWSTSEVEYGSVAYAEVTFPYTMPNHDVTLYPVYRINDTEDYHRVTSDLGANNWAGDYLIAASSTIVANGKTSNLKTITGANIDDNIVPESYGNLYYVSLLAVEGGYVLKTQDNEKPYVYITPAGTSTATNANLTTADNNPLSVTYNSESNIIITNPQNTSGYALGCYSTTFGFYKSGTPIYLYRKSPLYTSSLICEEITAENAMVTSTAEQTVKVNVTATMTSTTINRTRELTVESDNTDFTATITETATNTYNVAVSYTPSAEDNKDGKETATITINVNDIPVTTFQVTGRHLPENFVIAAKWGDNWYALPANCVNSGDSKQGILIDVNDINNPTSAIAPTTTKYGLRGVKPGRQTTHGQSILFTERVSGKQYALYQNNGANENIWVYAQYDNYDGSNPTYYEWTPSTNDLTNYTFTHSASSRKLGVNENGVFGAYTTDVQVRLLPATFYDQVAVQVIKWKENSVIVMYTGAATTATTQVGTNAATAAQTLANQKITHGIYELTTAQSLTANAGKILTMCFGTAQVKVEIPLIVNGNTTASKNGHDVVILDRGTLTASTTLYSYKNVYVYGGGKLAIPTGTQLGVKNIILRAGGVATDGNGQNPTYQHIYPQVELKGTLSTPTDASGFMKYEYVTDYDHWYHLVLPFDARYNTITYPQEYYGDNVTSNNTGSWQIKRYAGEIRATGNYDAWVDIETENAENVTAGKGYIYWAAPKKVTVNGSKERQKWGIQRITLGKTPSVATTDENKEKKISGLSSYATIQGNSGKDNDQGWNLIGNPYMMNLSDMDETGLQVGKLVEEEVNGKWTGRWEWLNDGFRYLTIPSDHFDTYTAKTISAATPLVAGRAFFVQLAGDANAVTFKAANRPNLMPALRATTQIEKDIETGIVLSNETLQDEMNFWIKDGKTNEYEYNADYPKTPNNNRFNIYGVHTNGDLSWVAISPELAAESMPIGYQVPAAGTYMLSLSETYYSDDLQALYVTDHAMSPEITVDLMTNTYYFDVNQAETNDTRFTVSLQVKSSGNGGVTTDNENIDVDKNQPIKFIYQDKLYILRNGVIYDGTGKQVQTINK